MLNDKYVLKQKRGAMCNAWNHPPNCICGWGGFGHIGRREAGTYLYRDYGSVYSWVPPIKNTIESYVNPNAWCPVCGDAVFFYQSPQGGRVFFDELGPPWPKHPCTDNGRDPKNCGTALSLVNRDTRNLAWSWQKEGWEPFFIKDVSKMDNIVFKLEGELSNKKLNLYLGQIPYPVGQAITITENTIAYLKEVSKQKYKLSLVMPSGKPMEFDAFFFASEAREYITTILSQNTTASAKNSKSRQTKTPSNQRYARSATKEKYSATENNKSSTAIALAFARAEAQKKLK